MDGQCDKLVTVVCHQFITLTVDICVGYSTVDVRHRVARVCRIFGIGEVKKLKFLH